MLLINDKPISVTIFPDKTSQVWKLPEDTLTARYVKVTWKFENEGEFMQLAQLKHLLNKHDVTAYLVLPYLPYGRQDKEITNASTFALRTFAHLLNFLQFDQVWLYDPHSLTAEELIKYTKVLYPFESVNQVAQQTSADVICYPDKGAIEKYQPLYSIILPSIHGEKVRDQLTGNILSYALVGDPSGKNVLIVDDICDGGATFKLLAKDLLAAGAKSVVLFVTHGIFSKGLQTLKDAGIQRIFTNDGEAGENEGSITYRRLY